MNSCLVVEDSRLARLEIVRLLKELDYFSEISVASNFREAKEAFEKTDPDVIFLDIDLPGKNGFEFLESLDHIPNIIFTTAFEEYAIKSYDYNAIDYVLKPIKKDRLEQAIAKVQSQNEERKPKAQYLEKVFVRDGEKFWLVQMTDIRIFESMGNYSRIYFNDNKKLVQRSLNYLESVLDKERFFRINRSQIINIEFIERMDTSFNGKLKLRLATGEEFEVSRRRSADIKNMFRL